MNIYQHDGIGTKAGYEPTSMERETALMPNRGLKSIYHKMKQRLNRAPVSKRNTRTKKQ